MQAVGVRDLKERTSEIVRRVREGRETIAVTYRGKVVARLVPAEEPAVSQDELARLWTDIDQLAAEISARRPAGVSTVDAINDVRRDL